MKILSVHTCFVFFFITVFFVKSSTGQEITGDTLYVNAEADVAIKFPSKLDNFYTTPNNAPYNLISIPKGLTVTAKAENTPTTSLFIIEGKRTHNFILVFKKNINFENDKELFFNYSDIKVLKQHVEYLSEKRKKNSVTSGDVKTYDDKANAGNVGTVQNNAAANYNLLIEEGDKNMKAGLYKEAKLNFENAHNLRPDDLLPARRLEEIKLKLAEKDQYGDLEKNRKYTTLTGQAIASFNLKKYAEAKELYKSALDLRPGDLYVTNQLEKIEKIFNDQQQQVKEKKLKDEYRNSINAGEQALAKNQLANARIAYEQALVYKPNDPVATNKIRIIAEKEKLESQQVNIENRYNEAIQSADKLYQLGDFDNAKVAYSEALALIKRPWPQEQLKNISKLKTELAAKEKADKLEQIKLAETAKREKDAMEIENRYAAIISEADKFFQSGDYTNARVEYSNALRVSNRPWPKEQLAKINRLIEEESKKAVTEKQRLAREADRIEKEKQSLLLESNYATAILAADNYFKKADYKNAKIEYTRAKTFFRRPWPDEQIVKINKIIEDMSTAENAEKQRELKEAKNNALYSTTIQKADAEFEKNNYISARKLYNDATQLKPAEAHPKERLQIIQTTLELIAKAEQERRDSIAAEIELNKKFNLAVSRGKSYILKEDYQNARTAYEEAITIKPGKADVQGELEKVKVKLAEIARENELNAQYDKKITAADSLLIAKQFESALAAFKEAAILKPIESYPGKQVKYIQSEIAYLQKQKEERDKIEAYNLEIEKRKKYRDLVNLADKSVAEKNFEAARQQYTDALALQPENDYARQRLKIVNNQLEKAKPVAAEKSTAKEAEVVKPKSENPPAKQSGFKFQASPIPYTPEELKTKYPSFDFASLPPEQPFNEAAVDTKEKSAIFKEMLTAKPRLDISDKNEKVKLVCQGLHFEDKSVYIKLLIQNGSDNDFLTGAMMLTWTRKSGSHIKLYPLYIYPSSLPIVQPGNETVVIYVCKSYNIGDEDKLKFELTDRINKTKLELNFKGSVYNLEFMR